MYSPHEKCFNEVIKNQCDILNPSQVSKVIGQLLRPIWQTERKSFNKDTFTYKWKEQVSVPVLDLIRIQIE